MKHNVPGSASHVANTFRQPKAQTTDFLSLRPSWRVGLFDINGKWGLKSLQGDFVFDLNDQILEHIVSTDDSRLYDVLEELSGKHFVTVSEFWKRVNEKYQNSLPVSVIQAVEAQVLRRTFEEKIYPKLRDFEKSTWHQIDQQTHRKGDKMVTNNHFVDVSKLIKEAQNRLVEMKQDDLEQIYSLRLEGKVRIYGIRKNGVLDIIWIDHEHEIYSISK